MKTNENTTTEAELSSVRSEPLLDIQAEKRRADRLATNCKWLIAQIDHIHDALCPDISGTWQQRATDAVAAARAIKRSLGEVWVAFLSDGERAFPVCTADSEAEARDKGRRLVGAKDAYFISVYPVPNVESDRRK